MADIKEKLTYSGIAIEKRYSIEEDGLPPREEIRTETIEFVPNSVLVTGENYGEFRFEPRS